MLFKRILTIEFYAAINLEYKADAAYRRVLLYMIINLQVPVKAGDWVITSFEVWPCFMEQVSSLVG
jgi:hypothetical protein